MLGLSQTLNSQEKFHKKGLFKSPFFLFNDFMKKELRKWAKEKRATLDVESLSSLIKQNLFSSPIYQNAKNIMCYSSFGTEVSTLDYFHDKSKNWFLPKCVDNELLCCPSNSSYEKNCYGILEPTSASVDVSCLDLIIIPALSADKNGYRIGYGKGYYDRLLKKLPKDVIKVVLVFNDLFVDDVHPDFYDEKCDYIITEKNMLKIG